MWFTKYLRDKNIKKGMFLLVLSGCLLLAGCQKETESENRRLDIWDNIQIAVPDVIWDIEVVDIDLESILEKKSIQEKIMSGDFSCLSNESWESEQESYERHRDVYEWRQLDLNGDGIEDLILQEAKTVTADSGEKRIIGIFACEKDEAGCILWDVNDSSEYYFCGATGELMYSASSYGGVVSLEPYIHYYFDEEWNEIEDYSLVVYRIDSKEDEKYAEELKRENPDMAEDGVYCRKYTEEGMEILTREELESIYEQETGYEFHSSLYRIANQKESIIIEVEGFEVEYNLTSRKVTVEDIEDIKLNSSIDEISNKLGEPDTWIGSGILRPVYFLEDNKVVVFHFKYPAVCEDLEQVVMISENGESQVVKTSRQ